VIGEEVNWGTSGWNSAVKIRCRGSFVYHCYSEFIKDSVCF